MKPKINSISGGKLPLKTGHSTGIYNALDGAEVALYPEIEAQELEVDLYPEVEVQELNLDLQEIEVQDLDL